VRLGGRQALRLAVARTGGALERLLLPHFCLRSGGSTWF
jgi:hypothetical protein